MRRRKFSRHPALSNEEATINLTPLLDVVFVVLIMFIVVAPLLEVDRVELASGGTAPQGLANQKRPIQIIVKKDNSLWINQQPTDKKHLQEWLIRAKTIYPDTTPLVIQDKAASFGTYKEVQQLVSKAGFEQIEDILQR